MDRVDRDANWDDVVPNDNTDSTHFILSKASDTNLQSDQQPHSSILSFSTSNGKNIKESIEDARVSNFIF